jgi:maltose/moltooligosaccharide transporter
MLNIQRQLSAPFYALLSLPSTAMGFALSVQISALSWILTTQYGLDIHDVGLVWAAGPLAGIIGQVLIGIISDNVWLWHGRRRPFILIGGVLAALMLLALPNIDVISSSMGIGGIMGVAIAIALTLDLAINISFNPTRAIIADVTPKGHARTKGYTWMQTISGSFGVLAYAIGAIWDNYALIYVGVIIVLAFSLIPPFFIEEPKYLNGEDETTPQTKASLVEILNYIQPLWGFLLYDIYAMGLRLASIEVENYAMEIFCLVLTLLLVGKALFAKDEESEQQAGINSFKKVIAAHSFSWIGVQTMFVYMFAYLQFAMPDLDDAELGRTISLAFLVLSAVSAILPAFVLEPISERLGRVKTHTLSISIMALGYFGIAQFATSPLTLYLLMAIVGIGWGAIVSLPFAIMSVRINQGQMGLFMGLFNLSVVLPQLVTSLGIGLMISRADDKSIVFIISAISIALSALCWARIKDQQDQPGSEAKFSSGH